MNGTRGRERYYGDPLGWVESNRIILADETNSIPSPTYQGVGERTPTRHTSKVSTGRPNVWNQWRVRRDFLVADGDRRIEVIRRTGSVALRVHDPKSPHLSGIQGNSGLPSR